MYSLDINFLSDRTARPTGGGGNKNKGGGGGSAAKASPLPIILGVVVLLGIPALAGGYWFVLQGQKSAMEQRSAELDTELGAIRAQLSEVQNVDAQVQNMEADNQAIASVFDRIKPWSAMLQDIRSRVPNGVQVVTVEEFAPTGTAAAPPPSPSPSPSPAASPAAGDAAAVPAAPVVPEPPLPKIRIIGRARSFNDVNDFVLTLQRSPFLEPKDAQLVTSKLIDNPAQVTFANEEMSSMLDVELPQLVEFTLETSMTELTASQLMQDLQRNLAVGLASRIQTLRDRGVLKP